MLIHRQQQLSWSFAASIVLYTCACLLIVHVDQVTSMSLERLGVERNDIQQTPAKTIATNDAEDLVIDDDRRLAPVPTQDDQISDMYVLLPSLDKNTIEVDPNTSDGEIDMLMVESNQEPVVTVATAPVAIDTQRIVEVLPVNSEPEKLVETVEEQNSDAASDLEEISTQTTNLPVILNENDSLDNIDQTTEKLSDETNLEIQDLADKTTDAVTIFSDEKLPNKEEEILEDAEKQPIVEENTNDNNVVKAEVETDASNDTLQGTENNENTENMVEKFESVVHAITDMVGEAESLFENGEMDSEKDVANKDAIVQENEVPVMNIEQQDSTDAQPMETADETEKIIETTDELPEKIIENTDELPEKIIETADIVMQEESTDAMQLKDEQTTELPQQAIEIDIENEDSIMEEISKLDTEKVEAETEKGSIEIETITEKSEEILENEQAQENAFVMDAVTETFTDAPAEIIIDINTPVETEIIANEETELNMENAAENTITEKAEIAADDSEKVDKLESETNDSHDIVQQDQIVAESEQLGEVEKEKQEEAEQEQAATEFSVTVTEKNVENESEFVTETIVEAVSQIVNDEKPQEPESSTLLTSIIQIPEAVENLKVEEETPAPIKMENMVMHETQVSDNNNNNKDNNPTILNVIDSVLNYVNASFINNNNNNNNKQQQTLNDEHFDDMYDSYKPSLRSYEGAQVWRIVVQNDRDRRLADELRTKYDAQLWKEVKQEVDYLIKPHTLVKAAQHIRAANLSRVVLIDNLQNMIDVENPPAEQIAQLQNRKGHRLTWQAYHRLEDIHGFYDYLAKTYPDICSVETIGYSIEKRPLKILKISNGNAGNAGNPGIWIDGGMHAREWISPASVTYIANQIVEGWDDLPAYMKNVNWHIHAVANPDGYEYTHTTDRLWRKNMRIHGRECPGVDLNRNFGYMWGGKGTSANPCSQIFRGNKAFSEPEAFYISKYLSGFPRGSFSGYLSFHSYGQYILYPWGYDYALPQDNADLDRVARQAATAITKSTGVKYTVGTSATTLYPAAGGSDDWAKGFAGIKYSYTIEMGDTGRYGFVLPANFIETNGKDAYTFAETVARAVTQDQMRRRRGF